MRKLAPFFAAVALLLAASLASAQTTLPTHKLSINAGRVSLTGGGLNAHGQFIFAGYGFTLSGGLQEGNFAPDCSPCVGGQQVQIHTVYAGELSIRQGTLTLSGVSGTVFYDGYLEATAQPVTLPIRYSRTPFRVSVPVTLHGAIGVYERDPFITSNYFLFRVPVNLQGTATLTLRAWGFSPVTGLPYYSSSGLSYEF